MLNWCFGPSLLILGLIVPGLLLAQEQEPSAESAVAEAYCPKQEVAGEIQLIGSTTMQQLAALWADGFRLIHPQAAITIDCRGSESALPSLATDRAVIGLMSRPLRVEEQHELEESLNGRVASLTVCHDALGLVAHPENPVAELSCGANGELIWSENGLAAGTWGRLGLMGDWSTVPIRLHTPSPLSGTRSYTERLLRDNDDEGLATTEHASRAELIKAVSADRGGLGMVSLTRGALDGVKLIPVGPAGESPQQPTAEALQERRYPLIRPLSVVIAMRGESLTDPLLEEFMAYVLSRCGQQDVLKDGFLPLTRSELHVQQEQLGWNQLQ